MRNCRFTTCCKIQEAPEKFIMARRFLRNWKHWQQENITLLPVTLAYISAATYGGSAFSVLELMVTRCKISTHALVTIVHNTRTWGTAKSTVNLVVYLPDVMTGSVRIAVIRSQIFWLVAHKGRTHEWTQVWNPTEVTTSKFGSFKSMLCSSNNDPILMQTSNNYSG